MQGLGLRFIFILDLVKNIVVADQNRTKMNQLDRMENNNY